MSATKYIKDARLSVGISRDDLATLERLANERGSTVSAVALECIRAHLRGASAGPVVAGAVAPRRAAASQPAREEFDENGQYVEPPPASAEDWPDARLVESVARAARYAESQGQPLRPAHLMTIMSLKRVSDVYTVLEGRFPAALRDEHTRSFWPLQTVYAWIDANTEPIVD